MVQDNASGAPGTPTQDASTAQSGVSSIDYDALAKALEPRLAEVVAKQWQSGKDTRIAKLQGKVDGFEKQLARYLELTGQPLDQKALRDLKIEDLLAQQSGGSSGEADVSEAVGNRKTDIPGVDEKTLSVMGLDAKDAEVVSLLKSGAPITDFVSLAARKQAVPASPAGVMSSPGGSAQSETLETLTAELVELQRDPVKNWNKLKEVGAKQKALLPKS